MSTVSFLTKLEPGTIYFRMRSFNFMIKMSSNLELILWGVSNQLSYMLFIFCVRAFLVTPYLVAEPGFD